MGILHEFKVEPIGDNGISAKVYIDGEKIDCLSYRLVHEAGCLPRAYIQVYAEPCTKENASIGIFNKKDIARIMDEDEFNEFCNIWHNLHNKKGRSEL